VESGLLSVSAACRKYQIAGSVIDRWRREALQGGLETAPSVREKFLERENRELKEKLDSETGYGVTKTGLPP